MLAAGFWFYNTLDETRILRREYARLRATGENTPANLYAFYNAYIPRVGTTTVMAVLAENPLCHGDSHEFGKFVLSQSLNFHEAILSCGNLCDNGCTHGVLMDAFKKTGEEGHVDVAEIEAQIGAICDTYSRVGPLVDCVHAIGHGLKAATHGFGDAIGVCEKFGDPHLRYYCITGVFMQNDIDKGERTAQGVALHAPCDSAAPMNQGACYVYKTFRMLIGLNDYGATLNECASLAGFARMGCFHGLGRAYTGLIAYEPAYLHTVCRHAPGDEEMLACIDGGVEAIAEVFPEVAKKACASLPSNLRSFCLDIKGKSTMLTKQTLKLYYPSEKNR